MCGICGIAAFSGDADPALVEKFAQAMKSRGPDSSGLYKTDRVALGHRRLEIIDLSAASNQPMVDSELGLTVVFNGCIYNYRELREELRSFGYRFFSSGDTEVVLKAYHRWGSRCAERFYGMFAFAIFERESGRLVLARDRLGIKPLYYAEDARSFRFASSLTALLEDPAVNSGIDPVALHHYMSFHAVVPAPRTIIKGVRKVLPATVVVVERDGRRVEHLYWQPEYRSQIHGLSEAEWKAQLMEALKAAVRRRTIADVPTGVLLSGGLDSSLIVALMAQEGAAPKTFSVGFEAVNGMSGDEFQYSDLVARTFGTSHSRIAVSPSETLAALSSAVRHMSEPMMSHDAVAFYLLSKYVSQSVKVVQSGQGADEVFAGYHWYPKLTRSNDIVRDYAAVYFDRNQDEMAEALRPSLVSEDYSMQFVQEFFSVAEGPTPLDKALELDTRVMLVDDPVKRVDNMTMAHGLEARVPFLDHEVVELAARMPADLKVKNGGKHILKEAARDVLPAEIIDRPKGYFPVPALKYIKGRYLEFVKDVLLQPKALQRGIFNRSYVERLLKDPERNLTPKGHSKLWQVALLEYWLQVQEI